MHRGGAGGWHAVHLSEVARARWCKHVVGGGLSHSLGTVEEQLLAVVRCLLHLLQPTVMLNLALSREGRRGERMVNTGSLQRHPTRAPYTGTLHRLPGWAPWMGSLHGHPTQAPYTGSLHGLTTQPSLSINGNKALKGIGHHGGKQILL